MSISHSIRKKYRELVEYLSELAPARVAYSGGVDSAFLLYAAHEASPDSKGFIARSPSLSEDEFQSAFQFTKKHGIPLEIIYTREMDNPEYTKNDPNRCYHCKKELFTVLEENLGGIEGTVLYGANLDDQSDIRPGMQAAKEKNVRAPLLELKWTKREIREAARELGLEVADKPAQPCMASRIPTGMQVTTEKLKKIEQGERLLRGMGFSEVRVRHFEDTARIEVPVDEIKILLMENNRATIVKKFKDLGYRFITLDLEGFRSGKLVKDS